jgi:hypothetical protein
MRAERPAFVAYVARHLEASERDASLWWAWLSGARQEWRGWVCEIDRILWAGGGEGEGDREGDGEGDGERGGGRGGEGGEGGRRGVGGQMAWQQLEERLLARFFQVN